MQAYLSKNQMVDAVSFILRSFDLEHPNLASIHIRENISEKSLLLTAEGPLKGKQNVHVPSNLFQFDLKLVINLLAHEMLHVRQRDPVAFVEDKNEREFQAYYEMLFHEIFPRVPDAPKFNQKQFAEKALVYYERMEPGGVLRLKYQQKRDRIIHLLDQLSII